MANLIPFLALLFLASGCRYYDISDLLIPVEPLPPEVVCYEQWSSDRSYFMIICEDND